MKIQRTNPVGIDKEITKLQDRFYDLVSWSDYWSHDRVYLNLRDNKLVPELYEGDSTTLNRDYREIYFSDTRTIESYFVVSENRTQVDLDLFSVDVGMIFQSDLIKLFPAITHRADEELHSEAVIAMTEALISGEITGLVTGIPNVYQGLDQSQIQTTDIHPCHVFRINFNMVYNYDCCC